MRLVQIGRRATTVTASPEQLEDARAHYARDHWLSLEGFVEPDLLAHARALIEESPFQFLDSFGTELRMDSGRAFDLLEFVTNDQALYSFVERVTGCEAIGCFHGRIYRMGAEHVADWHDDVVATRMVAMTINLSAAPFAGGELQLMDTTTGHALRNHCR